MKGICSPIMWLIFLIYLARCEIELSSKISKIDPHQEDNSNCDEQCLKDCQSKHQSKQYEYCASICGCDYLDQVSSKSLESHTTPSSTIWSIHIKNSITSTSLPCSSKCNRFCNSLQGNYQSCLSQCTDKFCLDSPKASPISLTLSLIAISIFLLVFLILVRLFNPVKSIQSLYSSYKSRQVFSYHRV